MQNGYDQLDQARIAANLRRAIELTELGLALRRSVLQQDEPQSCGFVFFGEMTMLNVWRSLITTEEDVWRSPVSLQSILVST